MWFLVTSSMSDAEIIFGSQLPLSTTVHSRYGILFAQFFSP